MEILNCVGVYRDLCNIESNKGLLVCCLLVADLFHSL